MNTKKRKKKAGGLSAKEYKKKMERKNREKAYEVMYQQEHSR